MINKIQLTENIKTYVIGQLDKIALESPAISFMKPFLSRAMNKNFHKVETMLDLISDTDGNIDIENIMAEVIENLMNTKPFVLDTKIIGDLEVGEGSIRFNIPIVNKKLAFTKEDVEALRDVLINKQ